MAIRRAVLVVVGGLPGTGKSTVATAYVRTAGAAYLRIDTIEQALRESTGARPRTTGYEIAYALAAEQLRLGLDVVAECVNPLAVTRDAWRRTARDAGAALVDVEITCSDPDEHRRRVETREVDVPGLVVPTWDDVVAREYEPWNRDRLRIDTARSGPEDAAELVAAAVGAGR